MTIELDHEAIAAIRGLQRPGQPDVFERIVDLFCASARRLLESMRDGVAIRDYRVVGIAAHTLKSSAANLGLPQIFQLCADIERSAGHIPAHPDHDCPSNNVYIDAQVAELTALYPHCEQALRNLLSTNHGG